MTSISNPSMMNRLTSKTIGKTRKSRENFSSCLFYGTRNGQKLVHTHRVLLGCRTHSPHTHTVGYVSLSSLSLSPSHVCVYSVRFNGNRTGTRFTTQKLFLLLLFLELLFLLLLFFSCCCCPSFSGEVVFYFRGLIIVAGMRDRWELLSLTLRQKAVSGGCHATFVCTRTQQSS